MEGRRNFSSRGTDTTVCLRVPPLPPAISRRKPSALTFSRRRSSPPAAQAPHPAWAASAPGVGASSQSQGPCNLGGRGGCTCCSSYCFINTKDRQMFGNEFFCLCWLWHFLDTNKKVANYSGDCYIFSPFPFNFVNPIVHSPSLAQQIN